MIFNSIEFVIFLPLCFILYWLLPHKARWAFLLAASYFFYMYWNWKLVFLIVFTTVVTYGCGLLLGRYRDSRRAKNLILVGALVVCLGVLVFFKYFNFLYEILCDLIEVFNGTAPGGYFAIILPVGISFYTFQTLSYVIDIYRGKVQPERHFGYFALFVVFFPQLVAGPIERPNDLIPQLKQEKHLKEVDFTGAFRYMLIGFFKKVAVADILGIAVNSVYNYMSEANGLSVLIATLLFSVQIFCDFSGYSDIAVGTSKLLGINLTENFRAPYSSKNIKEFWNRWHITFSSWLKDYVYFPLGGSRVKKYRWCINILIVFFVSGLWHGASYNFIIWGLLHGVFQIIGVLTLKYRNRAWEKMKVNPEGKFVGALRICGTFLLVAFTWIFFRANTTADAFTAIGKIFGDLRLGGASFRQMFSTFGLPTGWLIYIPVAIVSVFLLERLKEERLSARLSLRLEAPIRFTTYIMSAYAVLFAWVYMQASAVGSSFIYFQF